MLSVDLSAK